MKIVGRGKVGWNLTKDNGDAMNAMIANGLLSPQIFC